MKQLLYAFMLYVLTSVMLYAANPTVSNVHIAHTIKAGKNVGVDYDFSDPDGDANQGTLHRWYIDGIEVFASRGKYFHIDEAHAGKKLSVKVTPKDSTGAVGTAVGADNDGTIIDGDIANHVPTITLNGSNPLIMDTIPLYSEEGATAYDQEDGDLTDKIKIVSSVKSQTIGTYTVTYSVTDSGGKTVTKTRNIIIVSANNQLPLIEIRGDNPTTLLKNQTFQDLGAIGRDTEDGDISNNIKVISNNVDTSKAGTYEVKYSLTDSGGLTVSAIRKVIVLNDSNPIITLNGDSTVLLHIGDTYSERGASGRDNEDGDISSKIQINSMIDTSKVGTYLVTYTLKDSSGNSTSATRTIIVQNNTTGTLIGNAQGISLKHIGAGVGGAMFAIAIHPHDTNNIFFSGDMGLVYHTTNGGQSWTIVPKLQQIRFMQFDKKNPNIIWAGGGRGIFKSIDGGQSWKYSLNLYNYNAALGAMAIDPSDSNIIYIAEGFVSYLKIGWVRGKVWKSIDGGNTWKELPRPGGALANDTNYARNYTSIVIDPNSAYTAGEGHSRVYLMGRDGLFKSTNSGNSWQNITFFDEGQGSDLVLLNRNQKSVLYASIIPVKGHSKKGVYRSDTNGDSWSARNNGLSNIVDRLYVRNKDINNNALFSLMLAHSSANPDRLYVGSWQGIARSNNAGDSWNQTTPAEVGYGRHSNGKSYEMPTVRRKSNFPHSFLGGIDNFINISASSSNPNFVAFTDNQDIHFSKDAGVTWNSLSFDYTNRFVDPDLVLPSAPANQPATRYTHRIKSRGVQGIVNTSVAIDPFDPKTYYATNMDVGLRISRDGGISWEHPTLGLPPRGHTWAVEVDPTTKGQLWVSVRESGGIYQSLDSGHTWRNVSISDKTVGKITDFLLDIKSNSNQHVLYAATEKKGLYKSIDGGKNWQNIFMLGTLEIKQDPNMPNILYVATMDGLYKSTNSGQTWNQLSSNSLGKTHHVSISKNNVLYAIANRPGKTHYWAVRKLWRSSDGGNNFQDVTPRFMKYIGAVAVNPKDPNYVYIANLLNEPSDRAQKVIMARSKDGGNTWEEVGRDTAFALGTGIYIDPKNSQHIMFNTRFSLIEAFDTQAP